MPGVDVVIEKFGNEIDVSKDHSSATVAVEAKFIEGHALWSLLWTIVGIMSTDTSLLILILLEKIKISVVLVASNLYLNYES